MVKFINPRDEQPSRILKKYSWAMSFGVHAKLVLWGYRNPEAVSHKAEPLNE